MNWSVLLDKSLGDLRKNEFRSLASNFDRVKYLSEHNYLPQIDSFLRDLESSAFSCEAKCVRQSDESKTTGNKFYAKSDYKQAFRHYTLAILYAPRAQPCLLLGYANRSAVFHSLKLYVFMQNLII